MLWKDLFTRLSALAQDFRIAFPGDLKSGPGTIWSLAWSYP